MNERQDHLLFKARLNYEQAKYERNKHCDKLAEAKSSKRVWGEELDVLIGKLAIEAVKYIGVLQESYERRGYEVEELKRKIQQQPSTTSSNASTQECLKEPERWILDPRTPAMKQTVLGKRK